MAHFAKIENNVVVSVITVSNSVLGDIEFPKSEKIGQKFLADTGFEGEYKQTSYNRRFRKNYAGIGMIYDRENDMFLPPKPFKSWILDKNLGYWISPVPQPPAEPNCYFVWDEVQRQWNKHNMESAEPINQNQITENPTDEETAYAGTNSKGKRI